MDLYYTLYLGKLTYAKKNEKKIHRCVDINQIFYYLNSIFNFFVFKYSRDLGAYI